MTCKTNNIQPNVKFMPQRVEYFYGETVTFFCNLSFNRTSLKSTCDINEQWKPAPPTCSGLASDKEHKSGMTLVFRYWG